MIAKGRRAKALTLCATISGRIASSLPDIWHTETHFFYCQKYLRGAYDDKDRPLEGFLNCVSRDRGITIRFQHDNKHPEPYAGEISFQGGSKATFHVVKQIHKAWTKICKEYDRDSVTPVLLVKVLKALVVEYDSDIGEYYPGIQPGDPPLVQLARQA